MKRILLIAALAGCSSALPEKDPHDIAYTSLQTVDGMVPKLRSLALECRQHLEESRRMIAELEAVKKETRAIKALCDDTRRLTSKYSSDLEEMKKNPPEAPKEERPEIEYSPSDAPL